MKNVYERAGHSETSIQIFIRCFKDDERFIEFIQWLEQECNRLLL